MNVLQFPARDRAILDRVFVREITTRSASGVTVERYDPPREIFSIDVEYADGLIVSGIYDDPSYPAARAVLDEYRRDGMIVSDRVGSAWRR